jgi:hypothetical protein
MAAVPVTFQGILFFSDLGVGGGPMPGGPSVSHPIAPGGPPPQIWPGPGYPDQGLPGQPPQIWPSPGHPSHPIAPGGRPPGIWGGPPLYPDQGLPGQQPGVSHPIAPGGKPPFPSQGPGFPTNPIVIPPGALAPGIPSHPIYWPIYPDQGLPGAQPHPEHPIVIPGDDENNPKFEVKAAWTPQSGWVTVIVPSGDATVPTPST